MKVYSVGGCIRDHLLGITPKDVDFVVVGATVEDMLKRGFEQVGVGFPVFLHPTTKAEYALARKERKTGVGYNGFDVEFSSDVTLEEDLYRRDLTINAMAMDQDTGEIVDPYGGRTDLANRILRHVSEAFAEDPVRVLRVARFAARYSEFEIHPDTLKLMEKIAPELIHVPQERIWKEFEKGLMEVAPHRMFQALFASRAMWAPVLEPYRKVDVHALAMVQKRHDLVVRFLHICKGFEKVHYNECRIPSDCARAADLWNFCSVDLLHYRTCEIDEKVWVLEQWKAFNQPDLFHKALAALSCYVGTEMFGRAVEAQDAIRLATEDVEYLSAKVSPAQIAESCANKKEIRQRITDARVAALKDKYNTKGS